MTRKEVLVTTRQTKDDGVGRGRPSVGDSTGSPERNLRCMGSFDRDYDRKGAVTSDSRKDRFGGRGEVRKVSTVFGEGRRRTRDRENGKYHKEPI